MTQKSLDQKIARIIANPSCGDFIIADAKDADMGGGMAAPGKSPEFHTHEGRFRSLHEYRDLMRQNVRQGLVDIMLMSASSNEQLTIKERLFDDSHVTPAARANDTTDIYGAMGSQYKDQPSRPLRSATIDHIMCGKVDCLPEERSLGANLGLYSMTFNNDVDLDVRTLESYGEFRIEAERKGFRHFLEVFNPNAPVAPLKDVGRYVNDMIARAMAGVVGKGRPIFLKIPYSGPEAMEQLASYDRLLIPGIIGGAAGTTLDAFRQLADAKKYGARAALYGRMINSSEHQGTFIQHLRWIADGDITDPAAAVRSYHGALDKLGIRPYRSLEEDLTQTMRALSYTGSASIVKPTPTVANAKAASATVTSSDEPDFAKMSNAEKVRWNLNRWSRVLG